MKIGSFESEMLAHSCLLEEETSKTYVPSWSIKWKHDPNHVYFISKRNMIFDSGIMIRITDKHSHLIESKPLSSVTVKKVVDGYETSIFKHQNYELTDFILSDGFVLSEEWARQILLVEMDIE